MPTLPLLLLLLTAMPQSAAPSCDSLAQSLGGRACVTAGVAGVAVAADPVRAARLAQLAAAGEAAWRENYGADPARYVVFESGTPPETARDRAAFNQAGFPAALPVQPPSAWLTSQKRMIETQVRSQAGAIADEQRINDMIARIHANLEARNTPEAIEARESTGVPHELGHLWFSTALWPSERPGPEHVGGPAPDWLDEAAAQLAEPEASAERRREVFRQTYSAPAGVTLDALFAGPPLGVVRMNAGGPGGQAAGAGVFGSGGAVPPGARLSASGGAPGGPRTVIAGPESGPMPQMGVPQQALTRVFLDYLTAKSGDRAVIPSLARAVAWGGDLAQWLAAEGAGLGLPTTQGALEADWRAWVARTYPASTS